MRTEAYTVGFDTTNYFADIPEGYSRDEILRRREGNIQDNIIRYLGEYRLRVKFDEFHYLIKTDDAGQTYLESPHADPGPILNIYRKAIAYKKEQGLSSAREEAECLGFERLQNEISNAPLGTMALWVSPPGEDMGSYSFTFIAQVEDHPEQGRRLRVIPYRNELALQDHRDYLKDFHEDSENFNKDLDFLLNPVVVEQSEDFKTPDDLISFIGESEEFNIEWRNRLIPLAALLIGGFIHLLKEKASEKDLLKARYAIENRTIGERDYILGKENKPKIVFDKTPQVIFERYGNSAPPVVAGSCGMSSDIEISKNSILLQDKYGDKTFKCPSCGFTNLRPENELLLNCQNCGSDKVSCCDNGKEKSSLALAA